MNQKDTSQDPVLKMDILMWHVIRLLIKNRKQVLEKFGLTFSQFDILCAVNSFSNYKKEIIQINLSEKTNIDPMTTSTILRNLERKGLISRHRGTVNTRIVLVEITDDGLNVLEQVIAEIRLSSMKIYENIDKVRFTSQLLKLSDKLNN